jgi:hypothetical protein
MARTHFTPHPLCTMADKEVAIWLADFLKEKEGITDYIKHSDNPRWSAYHIVMALLNGMHGDDKASKALSIAAQTLSQTEKE